jgi:hypothetical protein
VQASEYLASAAKDLHVRSALNPLLWLSAISLLACIPAAVFFKANDLILGIFITTAVVPVFVACGIAIYFALTHPALLQSEDYQLRHEAMLLSQGGDPSKAADPTTLVALANPAARQLTSSSAGDQEKP